MVKRYFGSNESVWRRCWSNGWWWPFIYVATTLSLCNWCPCVQVLHKKMNGKNSIEAWLCLQNWEIDIRFLWMDGAHKTSFNIKLRVGVERVVQFMWVMGIPLLSPMVMSSLPPHS